MKGLNMEYNQNQSFIFFRSWYEAAESGYFDEKQKGEFYSAIINYCFTGEEPESDDPNLIAMFQLIKPVINRNIEKYQRKAKRAQKRNIRYEVQKYSEDE